MRTVSPESATAPSPTLWSSHATAAFAAAVRRCRCCSADAATTHEHAPATEPAVTSDPRGSATTTRRSPATAAAAATAAAPYMFSHFTQSQSQSHGPTAALLDLDLYICYRLIWPSVRVIPDPSSKVNGFLRRRQLWRPASAVDKLWMHVYLINLNFNAVATEMADLDTAGSLFNGRRGSSRVHLPIHDLVLAHPRNARPLAAR